MEHHLHPSFDNERYSTVFFSVTPFYSLEAFTCV